MKGKGVCLRTVENCILCTTTRSELINIEKKRGVMAGIQSFKQITFIVTIVHMNIECFLFFYFLTKEIAYDKHPCTITFSVSN